MQNDAPSRRGGVTEPNEFDEFRRRVAHEERRRRILVTVLDVLTALALLAIAGPRPQDDFLLAPVSPVVRGGRTGRLPAVMGAAPKPDAPLCGAAAMMQSGAEAPPHCRHANSAPLASSSLLR
jgi:hypothetical protein